MWAIESTYEDGSRDFGALLFEDRAVAAACASESARAMGGDAPRYELVEVEVVHDVAGRHVARVSR